MRRFVQAILIAVPFWLPEARADIGGRRDPADPVLQAEARLIDTIARISPAAVCIHDAGQRGGGSGVLIDERGYGVTNFHVVAGMLAGRKGWGGLGDGKLYELEVLGIDPVGDLAMFRLTGADSFPHVTLGDSDKVAVGDTVIALGNPFILSEDYTPSVSVGVVSGTHRYQWGVGGNLIYSDCIQVDAAINPGNSGGPLFNDVGEVIGINGRISVGARGRLNVGHGYAISSNQVRRFIPALRAGLLARHGTLGAGVAEPEPGMVVFDTINAGGPADRAQLRRSDRLVSFDGQPVRTSNVFASLLGTYPEHWPILLEVESEGKAREVIVRLDPVNPRMRQPFVPSREANLAAVRLLLDGFRRSVFRGTLAGTPAMMRWKVRREYLPDAGPARAAESYEVHVEGDQPVRMVRRSENGSIEATVLYDEDSAARQLAADDQAIDLPAGERMVLSALYVLNRRLLGDLSDEQLGKLSHSGADAIIGSRGQRAGDDGGLTLPLEVLDWPLGEQVLVKFLFEPQTGRVVRIRVRDIPTGEEATVDLLDYKWSAGLVLPHAMDVRLGASGYRDSLSQWEVR